MPRALQAKTAREMDRQNTLSKSHLFISIGFQLKIYSREGIRALAKGTANQDRPQSYQVGEHIVISTSRLSRSSQLRSLHPAPLLRTQTTCSRNTRRRARSPWARRCDAPLTAHAPAFTQGRGHRHRTRPAVPPRFRAPHPRRARQPAHKSTPHSLPGARGTFARASQVQLAAHRHGARAEP